MVQFTGYLIGKVQLDGAIRSEILMSLVESLLQRYQSPSDSSKKSPKFNENNKYAVECSERGLKLTSPSLIKSKDEGFESDCDSIRSIKVNNNITDSDLSGLMDFLDISKDKETDANSENNRSSSSSCTSSSDVRPSFSQTPLHSNSSNSSSNHNLHTSLSSGASSGGSLDNTSISSNSNLHVADDSNSSSGNGSDSDEFCGTLGNEKPLPSYWEPLPNASSFQSYPVEDVVFCHCDTVHPTTLIWVVRHLSKMIALVTAFRSRSEANELFQVYRELRVKLKPVKYGSNVLDDTYITSGARPSTPASDLDSIPFSSLPLNVAYPTEILHETQSAIKSPIFSYDSKSLDYDSSSPTIPIIPQPMSSSSSSSSSSSNNSNSNNNSNNNSKVCSGIKINPDLKEPMKMNTFGLMMNMNMNSSRMASASNSHLNISSPKSMQSLYSSNNNGSSLISHHLMSANINSMNYVTHDQDDDDEEDEEEDDTEEEETDEDDDDADTTSRSTIHHVQIPQIQSMDSLKFNTTSKAFAANFFSQANSNGVSNGMKLGTGSISGSSSLKNLHNIHNIKNSSTSSPSSNNMSTSKVTGIVFPPSLSAHGTVRGGTSSSSSLMNLNLTGKGTSKSNTRKPLPSSKKPVLMVPLKTESVTTPRSRYPKESYMYHVMNRQMGSSSTFAPYQRSLNFISPQHFTGNGNGNGTGPNTPVGDYNGGPIGWSTNGRQLLVPFSSWLELAEMPKIPAPGVNGGGRKFAHHGGGSKYKGRGGSSTSSLAGLKATKGTSKILLRDEKSGWATLSQRFKRNLRDNLMPKLNWMWTPPGETRPRKKPNKVTFNAWASVQIIE